MVRFLKRLELTPATPIYNIGAASRLSGLPIWTLRWIEKNDLVRPLRTEGNQRLFSERDIDTLRAIRDLMAKKVNLAGIRVILRLRAPGGEDSPTAPRSGDAERRSRRAARRS